MELDTKTEDVGERNNQNAVNQISGNGEHLKKDKILKIPKKRERTNDLIDVKSQEEDYEQSVKRNKIDPNTLERAMNIELNVKENQALEDCEDIQMKTNEDVSTDKKENMPEIVRKSENGDQKNMEKHSYEERERQVSIKNQKTLFQGTENHPSENSEKQATRDKNQACDNDEKTLNQEQDHTSKVCAKQQCDVDENQMFENVGMLPLTHESTKIQKDKEEDKNEILEDKKQAVNEKQFHVYVENKEQTSVESKKVCEETEKHAFREKHVLEVNKEQICETKESIKCKNDKSQLSKEETKSKDNLKHIYSDREKHACLVKEKRIIRRFKDYNCKQMWSEKFQDQMAYVNCIITDIEGTTTSISFVKDVIYKYIDNIFPAYVKEHWNDEELANDVKHIIELSKEYEAENIPGYIPIPERKLNSTPEEEAKFQAAFLCNYNWQMENRPKSRYMKQLQGHLVADGYRNREVVGHVYDDVKVAFKLWKKNKLKVCTFSNGSIYAQHLLFHYSRCGNMEDYIDVYFDTTIGEKIDPSSYSFICSAIKENPEDVLFLTDLLPEACAAKKAGLKVLLVQRETAVLSDDDRQLLCHTDGIISSFSDIICPPDL